MAAPGAWQYTNATRQSLWKGDFAVGSDSFKIALFTSSSNIGAGSTAYSGVSNQVANGNGYATGGVAVTVSLSGTTDVTVSFTDASWTGSSSGFSARYAALYKVGGNVVAWCVLDSAPADVTWEPGMTIQINGGAIGHTA